MVSIIMCSLQTLLWQSPIQTVNANSLICAFIHTVYLKANLNDLNTYVHRLNNLYIALNNNDIASTERYTVHLKHIAHGQSFSIFGFSRTIKGGTSLWYCMYVHFETPNQLPPITRRVRVRMILILTWICTFVITCAYINAVYPYMCLLDMCYSLNVETVFMCVYCIYKTVVCLFSYIRTRPVCLYAYISVLCITCVEHVSRSICVYLNIKSLMLCNQNFCGMLCTVYSCEIAYT